MKNTNKRTLVLTSLLCLLPILAGAAVYGRLPETMATHWGINGEPNGYSSRALAVFGLPGFLLALNLLLPLVLESDPKRANMSPVLYSVARWTVPAVSLLAGTATLGSGLGYDLRVERIAPVFIGLLLVIIGNYLPKTKQSYTLGIRLPWTLASEENWNRTHRLAGFLWVPGGIAFIVISFIGWSLTAFLIIMAVLIAVPTVYSYLLFRRGM